MDLEGEYYPKKRNNCSVVSDSDLQKAKVTYSGPFVMKPQGFRYNFIGVEESLEEYRWKHFYRHKENQTSASKDGWKFVVKNEEEVKKVTKRGKGEKFRFDYITEPSNNHLDLSINVRLEYENEELLKNSFPKLLTFSDIFNMYTKKSPTKYIREHDTTKGELTIVVQNPNFLLQDHFLNSFREVMNVFHKFVFGIDFPTIESPLFIEIFLLAEVLEMNDILEKLLSIIRNTTIEESVQVCKLFPKACDVFHVEGKHYLLKNESPKTHEVEEEEVEDDDDDEEDFDSLFNDDEDDEGTEEKTNKKEKGKKVPHIIMQKGGEETLITCLLKKLLSYRGSFQQKIVTNSDPYAETGKEVHRQLQEMGFLADYLTMKAPPSSDPRTRTSWVHENTNENDNELFLQNFENRVGNLFSLEVRTRIVEEDEEPKKKHGSNYGVTVRVEDTEFRNIHKSVLMFRSPFFFHFFKQYHSEKYIDLQKSEKKPNLQSQEEENVEKKKLERKRIFWDSPEQFDQTQKPEIHSSPQEIEEREKEESKRRYVNFYTNDPKLFEYVLEFGYRKFSFDVTSKFGIYQNFITSTFHNKLKQKEKNKKEKEQRKEQEREKLNFDLHNMAKRAEQQPEPPSPKEEAEEQVKCVIRGCPHTVYSFDPIKFGRYLDSKLTTTTRTLKPGYEQKNWFKPCDYHSKLDTYQMVDHFEKLLQSSEKDDDFNQIWSLPPYLRFEFERYKKAKLQIQPHDQQKQQQQQTENGDLVINPISRPEKEVLKKRITEKDIPSEEVNLRNLKTLFSLLLYVHEIKMQIAFSLQEDGGDGEELGELEDYIKYWIEHLSKVEVSRSMISCYSKIMGQSLGYLRKMEFLNIDRSWIENKVLVNPILLLPPTEKKVPDDDDDNDDEEERYISRRRRENRNKFRRESRFSSRKGPGRRSYFGQRRRNKKKKKKAMAEEKDRSIDLHKLVVDRLWNEQLFSDVDDDDDDNNNQFENTEDEEKKKKKDYHGWNFDKYYDKEEDVSSGGDGEEKKSNGVCTGAGGKNVVPVKYTVHGEQSTNFFTGFGSMYEQ